jgi:hypothetical protein
MAQPTPGEPSSPLKRACVEAWVVVVITNLNGIGYRPVGARPAANANAPKHPTPPAPIVMR